MTRDMVFVPPTKEEFVEKNGVQKLAELTEDAPITTLYYLVVQQLGGWVMYLATNVTGQQYEGWGPWSVNHFNPVSPIFDKKDYNYIILSDIGIFAQLAVMYLYYKNFGGVSLTLNYLLPWVGCNHWLVFITYLQHTDPTVPHFDADQWNFARGAATTIDRKFGFIGPYIFHDIIETHVAHHFCSRIPFYNGRETTEAVKKVLGKYYVQSDENMWVSLWKCARQCQFVDGDNGVRMFKNINGIGQAPTDVDGKQLK